MAGRFRAPSAAERLDAIGIKTVRSEASKNTDIQVLHQDVYPRKKLPQGLKSKYLYPDPALFKPVPVPRSCDWLACQDEKGQTFQQFTRQCRNRPDARRSTIYILPLSFFKEHVPSEVTAALIDFACRFFSMPVKLLEKVPGLKVDEIPNRINEYTGKLQIHAGKALNLLTSALPKDGFCLGALTLCDLYPRDEWNFVFGLASLTSGVGIYSLARYMSEDSDTTAPLDSAQRQDLLVSACRLMCHEICHMFGLKHCIYFHCLMNGSNNYVENQLKPLHLCPVCLRKLQLSCGFNIKDRYQQILAFCEREQLTEHTEWLQRRLEQMECEVTSK